VRRVLGRLKSGSFTYELDNGGQIAVAVSIDHEARSAKIDFTGSSMIPYAADVAAATGLPVFSMESFVTWFQSGLIPRRFDPRAGGVR